MRSTIVRDAIESIAMSLALLVAVAGFFDILWK